MVTAKTDNGSHRMRLLLVSASRDADFEIKTMTEHVVSRPYSIYAILYNLEQLGWVTNHVGFGTGLNPVALARRINTFKPDIIYTYGVANALMPLLIRKTLCRHRRFRVVHGWDDVYADIWRDCFGRLAAPVAKILESLIIRYSDAVVTLSRYNQERGKAWGVQSHFIPNGADKPCYDPTQSVLKLSGRFNVVYTGDASRWKRTEDACQAMQTLPDDIKLYFTGYPQPYLQQYASSNCIFLGWLSKNDQWSVMAQADAFVVTADQDCNAKLQEYLVWGKPIVGYDGRANNFFTNGRNALLTRDYASAFQRLAADPEFCRTLALNAASDLPVDSWLGIAKKFETFFTSLA